MGLAVCNAVGRLQTVTSIIRTGSQTTEDYSGRLLAQMAVEALVSKLAQSDRVQGILSSEQLGILFPCPEATSLESTPILTQHSTVVLAAVRQHIMFLDFHIPDLYVDEFRACSTGDSCITVTHTRWLNL